MSEQHPSNYYPIPEKPEMKAAGKLYSYHLKHLYNQKILTYEEGLLAAQQWKDFYWHLHNGNPRDYNHGYQLSTFFACDTDNGCLNVTPVTLGTFQFYRFIEAPEADFARFHCYFHYQPRVNNLFFLGMGAEEDELIQSGWPTQWKVFPDTQDRWNFEEATGVKLKPIGKLEELDQAEFGVRLENVTDPSDIVW